MIKNRKQRPPNGPGANGLRGGTNLYSTKTAIHRWQDDVGGPMAYKRGFTTQAFETEAQFQQKGATLRQQPHFGAALPVELEDKSPSSALWESSAHAGMKTGMIAQAGETHLPTMNQKYEELEQYRKTWSTDCPASRDMRFQTENRRSTLAAPKQFQMPTMRLLPGTPRPLETFRERLIEKHGILALSNVRFYVGIGDISCDDLKKALAKTAVKADRFEFNQILGYFTPTGSLSADAFIRCVVARTDGFDQTMAKDIFTMYAEGESIIPIDVLLSQLDGEEFPEIVDGMGMYMTAYAMEQPGNLTNEELSLMLSDMYASNPKDYQQVINRVFRCG